MSSSVVVPVKQDVPKELWSIANTFSDDAQTAALKKCTELGFDTSKGRISLEEALINLTHVRETLLDAIEKRKLIQLPLKLQYVLLEQSQKVGRFLSSLANGTDEVLNLEDAIDDLNASVWQFNLHNLSGQILGFQNKMNQLKQQETVIKSAAREAERFADLKSQGQALVEQISSIAKDAQEHQKQLANSVEEAKSLLNTSAEQQQRISSLATQAQQTEASSADHLAKSNLSVAETIAIANKSKELHAEIESARTRLSGLVKETEDLITATNNQVNGQIASFSKSYETLSTETKSEVETLIKRTEASFSQVVTDGNAKADKAAAAIQQAVSDLQSKIGQVLTEVSSRIERTEAAQESRLATHVQDGTTKTQLLIAETKQEIDKTIKAFSADHQAVIAVNDSKLKTLTDELEKLEGQIRASIERATGYTLFHSFQRRQEDLMKSKRFWGYALGIAVCTSLIASGIFIWTLHYVQTYNAAFYLKLSISLPLIYAIAFCSVQYSRERRLEEEYAFKSNISISLDPYQKLVAGLIDKEKPEELAKYTAFVIDSVNRVFTSPTDKIFDDKQPDRTSAEKIIKSLGEFADPLIKAIKK